MRSASPEARVSRRSGRPAGSPRRIIRSAIDAASGVGADVAVATAAVESSAGLWSRLLSLAIPSPRNRRTMPITPSLLALIGRELATHGEFIADIRYAGGSVRLIPAAASYVVHGGGDPSSWIYSLTTFGPTDSRTYERRRQDVLHLLYGQTSAASWRGVPPWASASLSGRLLAGVERQLAGEASSASGYFLVGPDAGDRGQAADSDGSTDPQAGLLADMAAAKGKTMIAPTMRSGHGAGAAAAPEHDYQSVRFGMAPPETTIEVRRDLAREIASTFGVPPVLLDAKAPGAALREGWRFFVGTAAIPLAELVASQLGEALGEPALQLDMRRALAAERTVQALAAAKLAGVEGVTFDQARELVGL